jgi:hypothetical protein
VPQRGRKQGRDARRKTRPAHIKLPFPFPTSLQQDLVRKAYGTNFAEALRVQVHANTRLRRVYFSDKAYSDEQLPAEFRLFVPLPPK